MLHNTQLCYITVALISLFLLGKFKIYLNYICNYWLVMIKTFANFLANIFKISSRFQQARCFNSRNAQSCMNLPFKLYFLKSTQNKKTNHIKISKLPPCKPCNVKQPSEVFCKNTFSQKFRKIHMKTPVTKSLF